MLNVQVEKFFDKQFPSMERQIGHKPMRFAVKQITDNSTNGYYYSWSWWLTVVTAVVVSSLSVQQTKRFIHNFRDRLGAHQCFASFFLTVCVQTDWHICIFSFSLSPRLSLYRNKLLLDHSAFNNFSPICLRASWNAILLLWQHSTQPEEVYSSLLFIYLLGETIRAFFRLFPILFSFFFLLSVFLHVELYNV